MAADIRTIRSDQNPNCEKDPSFFLIDFIRSAAICRMAGLSPDLPYLRGLCSAVMAGATSDPGDPFFQVDLSFPAYLESDDDLVGLQFHPSRGYCRHPGQFPAHVPSLDRFL